MATKRYTQRRPSIIRTLWVYRKLFLFAFALGVVLWFVMVNRAPVNVQFPFGMGQIASSLGIVILGSLLVGAALGSLAVTVFVTLKRIRTESQPNGGINRETGSGSGHYADFVEDTPMSGPKSLNRHTHNDPTLGKPLRLDDELPPSDYAARTKEGFTKNEWS